MVEHHHLMDHRELEVRGRVINRNPRVLDELQDDEGHRDQSERRKSTSPGDEGDHAVDLGQRERAGDPDKRCQRNQ